MKTRDGLAALVMTGTILLVTGVERTEGQVPTPPYLTEMPSEERILREVKGSDPADTAQRQVGAFIQLIKIIPYLHGVDARVHGPLTPAAKQRQADYTAAYTRVWKSRPELADRQVPSDFGMAWLSGSYDVSEEFRDEILNRFFPPALRTRYYKAKGESDERTNERIRANTRNPFDADEPDGGVLDNRKMERAHARCVASGRGELLCMGELFGGTLTKMGELFTGKTQIVPGLRLLGAFPGTGGFGIDAIGPKYAALSCRDARESFPYAIDRTGSKVLLTIPRKNDAPIVLEALPDGRLSGSGQRVTLTGSFTTGLGTYRDPLVTTNFTRTCNIGMVGPVKALQGATLTDFADIVLGEGKQRGLIAVSGYRMAGEYRLPGGLLIEFHPDAAVLECGEAIAGVPYRVEQKGSRFFLTIQNGARPAVFEVRPDGSLSGPETIEVNGQAVVGFVPDQRMGGRTPVFESRRAVCGTDKRLTDAPPGSRSTLTVVSGFSGQRGAADPLAGRPFVILKQSLETLLQNSGTSVSAWAAACRTGAPLCLNGLQKTNGVVMGSLLFGPDGRATTPNMPPGTYYVLLQATQNNVHYLWNVRVELKPGANTVTLDTRNIVAIKQ